MIAVWCGECAEDALAAGRRRRGREMKNVPLDVGRLSARAATTTCTMQVDALKKLTAVAAAC